MRNFFRAILMIGIIVSMTACQSQGEEVEQSLMQVEEKVEDMDSETIKVDCKQVVVETLKWRDPELDAEALCINEWLQEAIEALPEDLQTCVLEYYAAGQTEAEKWTQCFAVGCIRHTNDQRSKEFHDELRKILSHYITDSRYSMETGINGSLFEFVIAPNSLTTDLSIYMTWARNGLYADSKDQ